MNYFLKFAAVSLLLFLSSCVPPQQEPPDVADDDTGVNYQEFYDGLSPYGHWVHHPQSGYVWIPEAGPDFVPYSTGGYWVWSDEYGWVWASDYQWGWAPFHYGRWDNDDEYGWYWVPDLTWGPAWVAWRQCPGYYGWAPMRPGIGMELVIGGRYLPPERWWTGCDGRYFGHREMRDHYDRGGDREHGGERVGRIFGGESRPVGNAPDVNGGRKGLVTGPSKKDIEAVTHVPLQAVKITRSNTPGESLNGSTLNIYRPQLAKNPGQRSNAAPAVTTQQSPATRPTEPSRPQVPKTETAPAAAPAQQNPTSQPAQQNQAVPRSVTTMKDIRDLRRQANPEPKVGTPPRENREAPRQQQAPKQQAAPRQQPSTRVNEGSGRKN